MPDASDATLRARRIPVGRGRVRSDAAARLLFVTQDAPRVAVLGPVAVTTPDGRPVDLPGATARALVAALALSGSRSRSVEALTADVWGEDRPQNPRGALQTLVSRLRAAAGPDLVRSDPSGYALGVPDDEVDLSRARRLCAAAERLVPGDAAGLALFDEALGLWRGEAGPDVAAAPVADELADAAATLRVRVDTGRARALVAGGRPGEGAAVLAGLAAVRPYDEALHGELMTALAADARGAEALGVFAALRTRLRDDLGSSPGPELTNLNTRLLRGGDAEVRARVRIGLRAAPNELIGRAGALEEVAAQLTRSRLVTILGAGGLGKTRLAQAAAAASASPAVVVVPLASVRADDDVPLAIAAALGISEASPGGRLADARSRPDLRARVAAVLGERPTLLVLDNCEQVVDGVAAWVADMLAAVPALRVLATSRTPLAVAAEQVYPLDPLPTGGVDGDAEAGPAVRLFLERARAVRPGAVLPLDVVTRLCDHLDGLPLAIELAAARVRTMTPEQIEARLQDRFALLVTGDRTAPERHRTLEAVIRWSWDLLDPDSRTALATLSLLPGGFSADTAAGVLIEESADDLLDRLVAQSLLVVADDPRSGGVRFRMLETVREFGLSRLAADGAEGAAWDAVVGWALAFADERGPDAFSVEGARLLRAEHDNLIAVVRHAMDAEDDATAVVLFALLSQSWIVRGSFSELQAFGPPALEAVARVDAAAVPADALATVLLLAAVVAMVTDDPRALRLRARLRILRRRAPLTPMLGAYADLLSVMGDPSRAQAEVERLRASDDPTLALVGETVLAQYAENDGDTAVARDAAARAWELAAIVDNPWFAAMSAVSSGQLASQVHEPAEALAWLDRAAGELAAFEADGQLRQLSWIRGGNLISLGRFDEARELYVEMTATRELTEDGLELSSLGWLGLAELERASGDRMLAAELYEKAMAWFDTRSQRASPWYATTVAALVAATAMDESLPAARIDEWARRLRTRALATVRVRSQFIDRPVLGTVLAGWSAWAVRSPAHRESGLEALAIAEGLGSRQDLPSLHLDEHFRRATDLAGADAVAAVRAAAGRLDRAAMTARALELLRTR